MSLTKPTPTEERAVSAAVDRELANLKRLGHKVDPLSFSVGYRTALHTNLSRITYSYRHGRLKPPDNAK